MNKSTTRLAEYKLSVPIDSNRFIADPINPETKKKASTL
jgi:hypothetical protein